MNPVLLDEKSAAEYLGGMKPLSVKTLQKWRIKGAGPTWVRIGGSIRYKQSDLDQFIESSPRRGRIHGPQIDTGI